MQTELRLGLGMMIVYVGHKEILNYPREFYFAQYHKKQTGYPNAIWNQAFQIACQTHIPLIHVGPLSRGVEHFATGRLVYRIVYSL